jgi:hypothetical protein
VLTLTAVVLALGIVGGAGSAAAAGAKNVKCHSGDILEGTYHNVDVPKGNFCLLLGTTVLGNVTANRATQLGIDNSSIHGNVEAHDVTDNGWVCGSTIGHNVDVRTRPRAPRSRARGSSATRRGASSSSTPCRAITSAAP